MPSKMATPFLKPNLELFFLLQLLIICANGLDSLLIESTHSNSTSINSSLLNSTSDPQYYLEVMDENNIASEESLASDDNITSSSLFQIVIVFLSFLCFAFIVGLVITNMGKFGKRLRRLMKNCRKSATEDIVNHPTSPQAATETRTQELTNVSLSAEEFLNELVVDDGAEHTTVSDLTTLSSAKYAEQPESKDFDLETSCWIIPAPKNARMNTPNESNVGRESNPRNNNGILQNGRFAMKENEFFDDCDQSVGSISIGTPSISKFNSSTAMSASEKRGSLGEHFSIAKNFSNGDCFTEYTSKKNDDSMEQKRANKASSQSNQIQVENGYDMPINVLRNLGILDDDSDASSSVSSTGHFRSDDDDDDSYLSGSAAKENGRDSYNTSAIQWGLFDVQEEDEDELSDSDSSDLDCNKSDRNYGCDTTSLNDGRDDMLQKHFFMTANKEKSTATCDDLSVATVSTHLSMSTDENGSVNMQHESSSPFLQHVKNVHYRNEPVTQFPPHYQNTLSSTGNLASRASTNLKDMSNVEKVIDMTIASLPKKEGLKSGEFCSELEDESDSVNLEQNSSKNLPEPVGKEDKFVTSDVAESRDKGTDLAEQVRQQLDWLKAALLRTSDDTIKVVA